VLSVSASKVYHASVSQHGCMMLFAAYRYVRLTKAPHYLTVALWLTGCEVSAFCNHVVTVNLRVTEKQVLEATTRWHVARVTDPLSISEWAIRLLPDVAMDVHQDAIDPHLAVATT